MNTLDLDKLPEFAQSELQDFYEFLLQKYASEIATGPFKRSPLAPRLVKQFNPFSRDTIYDR